jgi:hypothetical protein
LEVEYHSSSGPDLSTAPDPAEDMHARLRMQSAASVEETGKIIKPFNDDDFKEF